jgi:signal peptide peptidase SppA
MATKAIGFFDNRSALPEPLINPLISVEDGVGIIVLHGPMMRNPDFISRLLLDALDTEQAIAAVSEAAGRDDVQAIFLDIDSPGGTVNGTPELAQAVSDASQHKHVYAFSAGQMCSAAYWVASQCDAIYASPSARVGSIGVILPFVDDTEALRNEGLKVEVFAAGKFKSAGTPGVSLTDEQRSLLQGDVEEIAKEFRNAVLARGRRIPDEAMEGQSFSARNAQRHNLAGMVKNRAEALARLRSLHVRKVDTAAWSSATMKTLEEQLSDALTRVSTLEADARARETLLSDASTQLEAGKTRLQEAEVELATLKGELATQRESLTTQLIGAQQELERSSLRNKDLESQVTELRSREQDLDKRAAVKAAQIAAEMGSPLPAKITPKGNATTPAPSAAAVWNRQFQPRQ